MCDSFERKHNDFQELKNLIYAHGTAIKNGRSSSLKFKNQDLHDLFLETHFWINLCPAKN